MVVPKLHGAMVGALVTSTAVALAASLILGGLATPRAVDAQTPKSTARLALLGSSTAERDKGRVAAFRLRLQELGWVDGRNLSIEQRFAAGQFDRLPALAAELVRLNPDVLVV